MSKLVLLVILPLALSAQTAPDAVTRWIRTSAIPLTTPVAGHGFDDMQPLKKVVGDARIVSLGEATHGSREFFQLKHRMVEFLATEMGFTIFSIEASMPEAYKLNDYVLRGEGDPAKLIKGMYFWTWDTEEVLDMVRWMRAFNQSGKGHIEFTGFDMQTPNVAASIVGDFAAKADPEFADAVKSATRLAISASSAPNQAFGTSNGTLPVEAARGKTIHFSGYIKTQDVENYAGFWWRADEGSKPVAFANLGGKAPKGTTDWALYELDLPVPANATQIVFGALLSGAGTAWYDDLKIEIDGKAYAGNEFDFSFEGTALKGLYPSVGAFPSRLVSDVAHSGKQSLRMSHANTASSSQAVDPKVAAAEWKKIVAHMEETRSEYVKKAAPRDTDWAIQNARVVLQSMQMRANQVSRDDSMAANVKWILDQNPGAKIALWAHNGHVGTDGMMGGSSMGVRLREWYGEQMVVFGFSFNQGGFQAVSQKSGLHDFNVPPARAGTLDSTLAASGLPLFALDLRNAPKGDVSDWLGTAHGTRSIGAVYPEDDPYALVAKLVAPQAFNVVLFVEKTTPARKNTTLTLTLAAGPADDAGAVEWRDPEIPVSVKLPKGWKSGALTRWGDKENTALVLDPQSAYVGSLYYKVRPNPAKSDDAAYALLENSVAAKANQRAGENMPDYAVRQDTIARRTISGHPALSCVADFTGPDGGKMIEYLTWVNGDKAGALFFARGPAETLASLRDRIDAIIQTLKLE